MRMKLLTMGAIVLAVTAVTGIAQEQMAVIEEAEGTVEVQLPGEDWQPVAAGDAVPVSAKLSTGFDAQAMVAVTESTVVTVDPLTRLTVEDIALEEGIESSELNLEVGRVEGSVKRVEDRETRFDVSSPVATASVRGTQFLFDGEELSVSEGVVGFVSAIGRTHSVSAGEENFTYNASAQPEAPAAARVGRRSVSADTAVR
ncbi:MAG: FecR family protein [Spirochaetia bacterium]